MSSRSLLTNEERVLLRTKYLADVHKEYSDIVKMLNLVAEKCTVIDGDDVFFDDATQIRFLKKLGANVIQLENAAHDLKLYLRDIAIRLEILS